MMNRRAFLWVGGVWLSNFGVKPAPVDTGKTTRLITVKWRSGWKQEIPSFFIRMGYLRRGI